MMTYFGTFGPALAIRWGWRVSSVAFAGLMLFAAAVSLGILGNPRVATKDPGGKNPATPAVRLGDHAPWVRNRRLYVLMMGIATATAGSYSVLYATKRLGFDTVSAGFLVTAMGVSSIVARFSWAMHAEY